MEYQDLLMKMGIGSAHPGGFLSTERLLNHYFPHGSEKILELGCGTGRTACELANRGYQVTAIDIRPEMIEKAKKRAEQMNVSLSFQVGDLFSLPFLAESFDVILIESLTVFLDVEKAIDQYKKLLRTKGMLFDREMMAIDSFPPLLLQELFSFYGIYSLPTSARWKELFSKAGFSNVTLWDLKSVQDELDHFADEKPDPYQIIDEEALLDSKIIEKTIRNTELTLKAAPYLYHGVIISTK